MKVLDITFTEHHHRIQDLVQGLSDHGTKFDMFKGHQDKENLRNEDTFMKIFRKLDTKLTMQDYKTICDNFPRFALYDDMKDLYSKCIPSIKGFETKILGYYKDNKLMMELIKNFDKSLAEKASRNSLENFIIKVEKTYASNSDQKMF